jgi:hypothetical protein
MWGKIRGVCSEPVLIRRSRIRKRAIVYSEIIADAVLNCAQYPRGARRSILKTERPHLGGAAVRVFRLAQRRKNKLRASSTLTDSKNQRLVRAGRAGSALVCSTCGALLNPKRGGRPPKFCSYHCRDEARRARNFAVSGATRYPSRGIPRNSENRPLTSTGCKDAFAGRTSSIFGPRLVIKTEIITGRIWQSVTSRDGVYCEVARLRRGAP